MGKALRDALFEDDDKFERYITLLAFWPILGGISDSYAHGHGSVSTADGGHALFALEHIIVYGGMAVIGLVLLWRIYRGWKSDGSLLGGLPTGYPLGFLGLFILLGIGGPLDMTWHAIFGFEQGGIELGSSGHIPLMVGALLLASTPLRRAWYLGVEKTWKSQFAMLTSLGFLLTILSWLIYPYHPFVEPYLAVWHELGAAELAPLVGVAGMTLYTAFFTVVFLHITNKFDIVPGGFTYAFTLNAFMFTTLYSTFIFLPAALIAGITADLFNMKRPPLWSDYIAVRAFPLVVTATFIIPYVAAIYLTGGSAWTFHEQSAFFGPPIIGSVVATYALLPSNKDRGPTERKERD